MAFVRGIHKWPLNSPHKWPVTRKMFPFDDVIIVDNNFTYIFLNENAFILIWISFKVPKLPIDN